MGRATDKDGTSTSEQPTVAEGRPGRVVVDNRGRNIWQWARDVVNDSTSVLLKRLENKDLALEPTQKVPVMQPGKSKAGAHGDARGKSQRRVELGLADVPRDKGGGFDPYNSR